LDDEETKKNFDQFFQNLEEKLKLMNVVILDDKDITKEPKEIGRGAFGKVYKGTYMGKPVALKKILMSEEHFLSDEMTQYAINDITNEIKTITYVSYPKIPLFYGLWKENGFYHLVFEFCEGKMLKDAYHKLTDKQKLSIVLQLSEALETIHAKKLIHRDIKPSNIMIDENLEIKLIDFGVSKIASKTCTFTKGAIGTMRYMAPEFLDIDVDTVSDKPCLISSKVDIWSTGCLISEIFSGRLPWANAAGNDPAILKKLLDKKPFAIPGEITNEHIKEIILKCVDMDPNTRLSASNLVALVKEKMQFF